MIPALLEKLVANALAYAIAAGVIASAVSGIYLKGRWDQRSADRAKIEKEISDAKLEGLQGRERALREFRDKRLPDSWFRD